MTAPPVDVVPVVASDWLRPRLGRTWTRGVVVGVTPRAAYIRIDRDGDGDRDRDRDRDGDGHSGGDVDVDVEVGVSGARPWPTDAAPDDRGRSRPGPRRPPATAAGSPASPSVVRSAGPLLALEAPGAVGLPNGLDVTARELVEQVRIGQSVTLDGDRVRIADLVLGIRRWRRSRPVPGRADRATMRRRLDALGVVAGRTVPTDWPDPPAPLRDGLDDLGVLARNGDGDLDVVDRLLGWGSGSTPAGDDLLAAWIATMTVLAPRRDDGPGLPDGLRRVVTRVREQAPAATTALSATLLEAATAGAMARPAGAVLAALTAPARRRVDGPVDGHGDGPIHSRHPRADGRGVVVDDVVNRLDDLAAVGHTSGRDLACGMLGAVRHLVDAPTPGEPTPASRRANTDARLPTRDHPTRDHPTRTGLTCWTT